jgi:GNAT superfamily N-acetyltransferase
MVRIVDNPGAAFAHLTFPRYRRLPEKAGDRIVCVGAESDGTPVALAIFGRSETEPADASLLSVMVDRRFRRQGLGRELLARGEARTRAGRAGHTRLHTTWSSQLPNRRAFEGLLARSAWGMPEVRELRAAGYACEVAAEMSRLEPAARPFLPPDASIDVWSTVTESEREQLPALVAEISFSQSMSPELWEKVSRPELSLVLRYRGNLAGWVFGQHQGQQQGQHQAADHYNYSCGYVVPGLRRRGALIALIREACRRQAEMFGTQSVAQLSTHQAVPGMPRFMRERLPPCSLWQDELRVARKGSPSGL